MRNKPKITIVREVRGLNISKEIDAAIKKVIAETLLSECEDVRFEVTVTYTNNKNIHELNKEFRNTDRPTDVLSFPMLEFKDGAPTADFSAERDPQSGYLYLGDIVLSADKAREQAEEYGHGFEREMAFLTAHSALHLLGYDHEQDEQSRAVMEDKQEQILQKLGITR